MIFHASCMCFTDSKFALSVGEMLQCTQSRPLSSRAGIRSTSSMILDMSIIHIRTVPQMRSLGHVDAVLVIRSAISVRHDDPCGFGFQPHLVETLSMFV